VTVFLPHRSLVTSMFCHNQISLTTQIPWPFADFSLTLGLFPDFSLTIVEFSDISRFPEISEKWSPCALPVASPTWWNSLPDRLRDPTLSSVSFTRLYLNRNYLRVIWTHSEQRRCVLILRCINSRLTLTLTSNTFFNAIILFSVLYDE